MPLLVFLNEQSCATKCGPDEVAVGMRTFVDVLRELRRWRDISLATQSPLDQAELAGGYYYAQWRNDARNKDGESRCFELHGNLNRGAGRIYFRLVHDEKAIRIAHIGRHL